MRMFDKIVVQVQVAFLEDNLVHNTKAAVIDVAGVRKSRDQRLIVVWCQPV
jgi:hypothetical protein